VKIVGISGVARSGKDTAAMMILSHARRLGVAASLDSFAAPLRGITAQLFFDNNTGQMMQTKEQRISRFEFSPREFMQRLGTEVCRELDTDIWVKLLQRRLERMNPQPELVVIPDVRFPNEAEWIRDWDGVVVRLLRIAALESQDSHSSEVLAFPADITITNNGSKEELRARVETVVETVIL